MFCSDICGCSGRMFHQSRNFGIMTVIGNYPQICISRKKDKKMNDDVKRKFIILPLVLVCCLLAGCSVSSNESSNTSAGTEIVSDQDDPKADISKIEQIYIDEYKTQDVNQKCVGKIIEKLGDNGFIAIDSENKVDMANAENMRSEEAHV